MAKNETKTETMGRPSPQDGALDLRDDDTTRAMREAYEAAGIPMPTELDSPEPEVQEAVDGKSLCDQPTAFPGAENESPLLILMTEPQIRPSQLKGSKSFFTAQVFNAKTKDSFILTHTYERVDDKGKETISPLGLHMAKLTPGKSVFKIATFKTAQGFHVVRPIPINPKDYPKS